MKQISVTADLSVEHGGLLIQVSGDGSNVIVEVPGVVSAYRLIRSARSIRPLRSRSAGISKWLRDSGIAVTLRTPRRRLLTIGRTRESYWMKLFGYSHIVFHLK
jgi:hypothetical protein